MKSEYENTVPAGYINLAVALHDLIFEKNAGEALQLCEKNEPGRVKFSTSLGKEDQVITEMIAKTGLMHKIDVFSLDTGRLFEETQYLLNMTIKRYGSIRVFFPERDDVENLVTEKGTYSFYESVDNRKECCYIRKVVPLNRALQGGKIWITGIRSAQSSGRAEMLPVEWDEAHKMLKVHPLFAFSDSELDEYVTKNNVLVNELHSKGFPSIGCAPCTRAVKPGEDIRAGRWWWEQASGKECGLHITK